MEQKRCEKCGKEFGCGAKETKCWCADLDLSSTNLQTVKAQYNDCLCGDCLKALSRKEKNK